MTHLGVLMCSMELGTPYQGAAEETTTQAVGGCEMGWGARERLQFLTLLSPFRSHFLPRGALPGELR